jgi:hypothetical protein
MGELASMNNEHAIVFAVGDREQCKYGYTTLIEWSTLRSTSTEERSGDGMGRWEPDARCFRRR